MVVGEMLGMYTAKGQPTAAGENWIESKKFPTLTDELAELMAVNWNRVTVWPAGTWYSPA